MPISTPCNGVTIGIPLYNEEKFIGEAIRSAALQAEVVWVSDNASTDGSAAICEALSHDYSNVHFVRQPENKGAAFNFKYLLNKAVTPYFMWLGSHDALPEGYVRQLLQLLEDNPDAVLAYGASRHWDINDKPTWDFNYPYHGVLADKEPATRVLGLIQHLSDCSLIHGIFRTESLRKIWNDAGTDVFLGADQVLLTHAAMKGPFLYAPETYLIRRDVHPTDTPEAQLRRVNLKQPDARQLAYLEMQRRQYGLAVAVSAGTGLSAFLLRLKARYFLVARFGPFGKTAMARKVDLLLLTHMGWIGKLLNGLEQKAS